MSYGTASRVSGGHTTPPRLAGASFSPAGSDRPGLDYMRLAPWPHTVRPVSMCLVGHLSVGRHAVPFSVRVRGVEFSTAGVREHRTPPLPTTRRTIWSICNHTRRPPIWCHSSTRGTSVHARGICGPIKASPVTRPCRNSMWAGSPERIRRRVSGRRRAARGYGRDFMRSYKCHERSFPSKLVRLMFHMRVGAGAGSTLRRPTALWAFGPAHSISGRRNGLSTHYIGTRPSIPEGVFDVLHRHCTTWYRFPCVCEVLNFRLQASASTGPPPPDHSPDHLVNLQPHPSTANMVPFKHQGY